MMTVDFERVELRCGTSALTFNGAASLSFKIGE